MSNVKLTYNMDETLHCVCGNCDWVGPIADLNDITDVQERVQAGEVTPAGECPECGALAHLDETNGTETVVTYIDKDMFQKRVDDTTKEHGISDTVSCMRGKTQVRWYRQRLIIELAFDEITGQPITLNAPGQRTAVR
jgi:hypothetical protein